MLYLRTSVKGGAQMCLFKCSTYQRDYAAALCTSPTLNRSSEIQCFECSDTTEKTRQNNIRLLHMLPEVDLPGTASLLPPVSAADFALQCHHAKEDTELRQECVGQTRY